MENQQAVELKDLTDAGLETLVNSLKGKINWRERLLEKAQAAAKSAGKFVIYLGNFDSTKGNVYTLNGKEKIVPDKKSKYNAVSFGWYEGKYGHMTGTVQFFLVEKPIFNAKQELQLQELPILKTQLEEVQKEIRWRESKAKMLAKIAAQQPKVKKSKKRQLRGIASLVEFQIFEMEYNALHPDAPIEPVTISGIVRLLLEGEKIVHPSKMNKGGTRKHRKGQLDIFKMTNREKGLVEHGDTIRLQKAASLTEMPEEVEEILNAG